MELDPAKEKQKSDIWGLSAHEAAQRLLKDGENRLDSRKRNGALRIFANQFHDIMVMILLFAMAVTVAMGQISDAVPILVIIVINASLGFFQEYRCERTLEKLEAMTAPTAKVYRDGRLMTIPSREVVCGDIISITAGDMIPCDGYIIKCSALECDESTLNGESAPARKRARANEEEFSEINLDYMLYMGTTAVKGSGLMQACFTGKATQIGRISQMISESGDEPTPLQKKLGELGKMLAMICVIICVLTFIAGILRGEGLADMLMTSITIAVAAIPEGLPAAVTIALSLSVRRMLKKQALVHRLHSVETLGCADVICTDKTGTLTQNKMTVTQMFIYSEKPCEYALDEGAYNTQKQGSQRAVKLFCECAALCNDAVISAKRATPSGRNRGRTSIICEGEPTEAALALMAQANGMTAQHTGAKRIAEQPFDSESRKMQVTVEYDDGRRVSFTKGAPDAVIKGCLLRLDGGGSFTLSAGEKELINRVCERYAADGLRVLALSCDLGQGEVFLGLAALKDPLREEARSAVISCRRAGIRTVMITGDHILTAKAIAKEAGILREGDKALTGAELDKLTDEQLTDIIGQVSVYARVTPAHKLRIVKALRQQGHICAMTGDGVNDAPAIKEADIGVSMGLTGTDVTKQAADVILLDDNFATLEGAVREGRAIYSNIRKFVRFLLGCNIGEVLTTLGAIVIGMPAILTPSQILLVNLVTDGLPAVALGLEPPEAEIMNRPPRKNSDSFFEGGLLFSVFIRGILIALSTLAGFGVLLRLGAPLPCARTGALITLSVSQLIHVFECRSEDKPLYKVGLCGNPALVLSVALSLAALFAAVYIPVLSGIFSSVSMAAGQLMISLAFAAAVPLVVQLYKLTRRR
ncbi:MAG: cation-translocating P-type ATPase [Ruminococcus sp.]|nr:cation-translocating P-type ATPase [Ruminococcus sp.]